MDFSKYKNNITYPSRIEYRKRLISEINDTPLTVADREAKMNMVNGLVNAWWSEAARPYNEEEARLLTLFWADCRADLGYDAFLNATGVAAVENKAWADGHANGLSSVYERLSDYVELLDITFFKALYP